MISSLMDNPSAQCGGQMRQEIAMVNPSFTRICAASDHAGRPSAKKICFDNGLELEVIGGHTLRILADDLAHQGTYDLWIVSNYVNTSSNELWEFTNTSLQLTIGDKINDLDCNRNNDYTILSYI